MGQCESTRRSQAISPDTSAMYFTFVPRIGLDITDVHNIDGLVFHCKHYTTKVVDTAVYRLMNTATRADASEYRDQLVKDVNEALEYLAASWRECALTMGDEIHSLRAQVAALETRTADAEEEARIAKERTICRDDETSNNVAIDHQWISPCPAVAPVQVPTFPPTSSHHSTPDHVVMHRLQHAWSPPSKVPALRAPSRSPTKAVSPRRLRMPSYPSSLTSLASASKPDPSPHVRPARRLSNSSDASSLVSSSRRSSVSSSTSASSGLSTSWIENASTATNRTTKTSARPRLSPTNKTSSVSRARWS